MREMNRITEKHAWLRKVLEENEQRQRIPKGPQRPLQRPKQHQRPTTGSKLRQELHPEDIYEPMWILETWDTAPEAETADEIEPPCTPPDEVDLSDIPWLAHDSEDIATEAPLSGRDEDRLDIIEKDSGEESSFFVSETGAEQGKDETVSGVNSEMAG